MHADPETPAPEAALLYADARELLPLLEPLAECRSAAELEANPGYRAIEGRVRALLEGLHVADFRRGDAPARGPYRAVAWNLERGTRLADQLDALRGHPYLSRCDLLLITEADAGMARSHNRMVAETLARKLGMAQVFAPCYLALGKGSGAERDVRGANLLGLHGNALLSRYPVRGVRAIRLENGVDKMAHREQRIGCQTAIAAEIAFPERAVQAVSVHLDAQSTQRRRHLQMRAVLDALDPALPTIVGGDWNTSTYDSSHALWAILGFWRRVFMGVDHVIRNHYLHPGRWFERRLFGLLEERGYDWRNANAAGEPTVHYDVNDLRTTRNLNEWVPEWCFAFIRWALRNHGGRCPLKLDWFATRGMAVESPAVIHDLGRGYGAPLSDHDPIVLDFRL